MRFSLSMRADCASQAMPPTDVGAASTTCPVVTGLSPIATRAGAPQSTGEAEIASALITPVATSGALMAVVTLPSLQTNEVDPIVKLNGS